MTVPALPDVLPMRPYFREMIWGGQRLRELYGKDLPAGKRIGESFELSACEGRESVVHRGPLAGWGLRRLMDVYGRELVGQGVYERCPEAFPLLIKLIDAQEDLSIQTHPGDRYAVERRLGPWGKMEAWYVLHSEAGRIAYGLKEGVGRAEFEAAVREGRVEDAVAFFEVRPGDVVFVPPGTVHALGRGVVVYEVQQSSDLTFRIYDYNRPGPDGKLRELHVDQALDVITFGARLAGPVAWNELSGAQTAQTLLVTSEHFRLERHCPTGTRTSHESGDSFAALTVIDGEAEVWGRGGAHRVRKGDTVLIPAGRDFSVKRSGEAKLEYLVASVPC